MIALARNTAPSADWYGSSASSRTSFDTSHVSSSSAVILSFLYDRPWVAPNAPAWVCDAMS